MKTFHSPRCRKVEVYVVTQRDEDGTSWLHQAWWSERGTRGVLTTSWSGPFEARTFITEALAAYLAKRINHQPGFPDYITGPAKVQARAMGAGFKDWINGKGK